MSTTGIDTGFVGAHRTQGIGVIVGRSLARNISVPVDSSRAQISNVFTESALHGDICVNGETLNSELLVGSLGRGCLLAGDWLRCTSAARPGTPRFAVLGRDNLIVRRC